MYNNIYLIIIIGLLHIFIQNNTWIAYILSFLTNLNLNYLYLNYIILCIHIFFFNKMYTLIYSIFWYINIKTPIIIALNNVLFLYHPTILYWSVIMVIYLYFFNQLFNTVCYIIILWFSFILGGVWASQEFNWGGWWNWDSLEMGILIIIIFNINLLHIKHTFLIKQYINIYVLLYCFTYWFLNKNGLTISIHSFIKNETIIMYKWSLLLLVFIPWTMMTQIIIIGILLLLNPINSVIFFKLIFFLFLKIFFYNNYFFKKIKWHNIHQLIKYHCYIFISINYNNILQYINLPGFKYMHIFSFQQTLFFISYTIQNEVINSLKKNFFFFKYYNYQLFTSFTQLTLTNFFSTSKWCLIL